MYDDWYARFLVRSDAVGSSTDITLISVAFCANPSS